ncbi:hypothetical protein RRG08_059578 [Elysia crispata]|uniref:Ig-like domain-containing protein n=1 Tax=Elysia crispata TaxID=231223 RepID=A0AAE1CZ96_9GAST|nr:hypothetical protein RRG08_059578 [Elysia crispata]
MASSYTASGYLLFLLVFIGIASLGRCQEPGIVEDILPEVKRVGMTARLNCTVARMKQGADVQWTFKNSKNVDEVISIGKEVQIVNDIKGGVKDYEDLSFTGRSGDRTTYQLVKARLRPEYDGSYECSIAIAGVAPDLWPRETGKITVLQAPTIRPGSTDSVKMLEKGSNSNPTCDAVGVPAPNITWVRSDGKLRPMGRQYFGSVWWIIGSKIL